MCCVCLVNLVIKLVDIKNYTTLTQELRCYLSNDYQLEDDNEDERNYRSQESVMLKIKRRIARNVQVCFKAGE